MESTIERKIIDIDRKCPVHNLFLKLYTGTGRSWCPQCAQEKEDLKNKKSIERLNKKKNEKIENRLQDQIGFAVNFESKNYSIPPYRRAAEVIIKLSCPNPDNSSKNIRCFFWGGKGTGKTLTSSLIVRSWARGGYSFHFKSLEDFKNDIFSDGFSKREEAIQSAKNSHVLVLDDVEYVKHNENLFNIVKNILDCRLKKESAVTILTSNVDPKNGVSNFEERRLKTFFPVWFGEVAFPYPRNIAIGTNNSRKIFNYIIRNGSITNRQAMVELLINSPQQNMAELERLGLIVGIGQINNNSNKPFKVYKLHKCAVKFN